MRQTFNRAAGARPRGRWVTSDFYDASRGEVPNFAVDAETVAGIISDIEIRGSLLDRGAPVPPPTEPNFSARGLRAKYTLDRVLAALMLIVLSPLMLLCVVLVKATSRGPVLFRQQRVGQNGEGFVMYKFRSMRRPTKLVSFQPVAGLAPGGVEGEDRRTRVGVVLRALSIDELPQLFNVLRGEMSLVGPRPERPKYVERFARELPGYADRHLARPGITGWAQVHGCRGATSLHSRLELDREYIQFWSFWLDLKILVLTCGTVVGMVLSRGDRAASEPVTEVVGRRFQAPNRRAGSDGGTRQATPQGQGAGSSFDS
jgi:lipopolysaccharide/colanic/teichoic acid biosynthesis glycosyltransferase